MLSERRRAVAVAIRPSRGRPEPGSMPLLVLGMVAVGLSWWRQQRCLPRVATKFARSLRGLRLLTPTLLAADTERAGNRIHDTSRSVNG
jgi:hypothetical protein